jgi:hypothetical protein
MHEFPEVHADLPQERAWGETDIGGGLEAGEGPITHGFRKSIIAPTQQQWRFASVIASKMSINMRRGGTLSTAETGTTDGATQASVLRTIFVGDNRQGT